MSELHNEKPPIFERWVSWYVLILAALVIQVIVYLFITKLFS